MDADPVLSLAEWIALSLVDERPRHGFAIAALTATDGEVGRVWHVPRPIVYRAVRPLTDLGLLRMVGTEHGSRGPQRSVLATTDHGSDAVARWQVRPVEHVRDTRSELLVKLALLARRDRSTRALITAQRRVFEHVHAALCERHATADGFDQVLVSWRVESAQAAIRFLDGL